ncbi:unnamed protein product [Meloidogyne enterolobii]|uniref:Uncharacterized protein n=1 Tax=Meloidogyne enterolobii TaxID=390850 RepID=A0ACB0ZP62_MELEN
MVLLFKAFYLQGLIPEMIKKGNKMYEMKGFEDGHWPWFWPGPSVFGLIDSPVFG